MIDPTLFIGIITGFFAENQVQLQSLLVLIVVDVLLGASAATKAGTFDLQRLASFYGTSVLGQLGGWLLFNIAARFMTQGVFGPEVDAIFDPVTANTSLAVVVASLTASISKSGHELGITFLPIMRQPPK